MYSASHSTLLQGLLDLRGTVGAVGVQLGVGIFLLQQCRHHLRIMDAGVGDLVGLDQLACPVYFDVILVSVMSLLILLRPPGVRVFLAEFGRVVLPVLGNLALFDRCVFFPTVSLSPQSWHR